MAQVLADATSAVSTVVGKAAAAVMANPYKSWIGWESAEQPVEGEEDKMSVVALQQTSRRPPTDRSSKRDAATS